VDLDRTQESRDYITSLHNTQYLDVVAYLPTPDAAVEALRRNDARVGVIIPPDFARRSGTADGPVVHVLLDGSDSQVAVPARNAFLHAPGPAGSGGIQTRIDVLFNPQMRTQIYTIPGLAAVILQLVTVSLTGFSLVREREQGTLEQLMVSPVGKLALMLGKVCPYAVLATFELITVLSVGWIVFDVHVAGSLLLLMTLAIPFILAALSMGLLISTVAQNQAQALQLTMLTLLPSILLSGYIAPRETLPGSLYLLGDVFPVTWFMQITRGVMVRAAGLRDLLPSVLALLLLTIILLTLATSRFRKSVA
jgi:ABC-type multidrug transport system permease subunit